MRGSAVSMTPDLIRRIAAYIGDEACTAHSRGRGNLTSDYVTWCNTQLDVMRSMHAIAVGHVAPTDESFTRALDFLDGKP